MTSGTTSITGTTAEQVEQRFTLPPLVMVGRPVSDNRYKDRIIVHPRKRNYRATPMTIYTPQAEAWMAQVAQVTLEAIAHRARGVPHPSRWPTPLRLTIEVRDGSLDLPNTLKATLDALKGALGVDDKHYELAGLTRGAITKTARRGMTIRVESAPTTPPATQR